MPTRLLLVEDDKDLRDFVREGMLREGFTVDSLARGDEVLPQVQSTPYDAVLLDVMIPCLDGFSVLKKLRVKGYKGVVFLITGRGKEKDKLQGFAGGADDYIVKPFFLSELIARVRAALHRVQVFAPQGIRESLVKAGDIHMDLLKHEVRIAGQPVHLTKKEFELLECFVRRPGHVLSQAVLSQQLSHSNINNHTNFIEVHLKNLRAKIDPPAGPSLIRTVRGCGYALEA